MRPALLTAVVVLAAAAGCGKSRTGAAGDTLVEGSAPPERQSITLGVAVPEVGTSWSRFDRFEMASSLTMGAVTVSTTGIKDFSKHVEILAVSGAAITKARIRYDGSDRQTVDRELLPEKRLPHLGHSYVLDATGGTLVITDDGGRTVSAEEIAEVKDDEDTFGVPNAMLTYLAGRTFHQGEAVVVPENVMKEMSGDEYDGEMSLTFSGMSGERAVFEMAMTMRGDRDGSTIVMDLKGTGLMDPETRFLVETTLEGPVTISGKITGTGTMKISSTSTVPR